MSIPTSACLRDGVRHRARHRGVKGCRIVGIVPFPRKDEIHDFLRARQGSDVGCQDLRHMRFPLLDLTGRLWLPGCSCRIIGRHDVVHRRLSGHRRNRRVGKVLGHAHGVAGGKGCGAAVPVHAPVTPDGHQYRWACRGHAFCRWIEARVDKVDLEPRLVADHTVLADHLDGFLARPAPSGRCSGARSRRSPASASVPRSLRQFRVGQHRHRPYAIGQCLRPSWCRKACRCRPAPARARGRPRSPAAPRSRRRRRRRRPESP